MNTFIGFIIGILLVIVATIAHERDIYSACLNYGHSGHAMFTKKIKCEEFK